MKQELKNMLNEYQATVDAITAIKKESGIDALEDKKQAMRKMIEKEMSLGHNDTAIISIGDGFLKIFYKAGQIIFDKSMLLRFLSRSQYEQASKQVMSFCIAKPSKADMVKIQTDEIKVEK